MARAPRRTYSLDDRVSHRGRTDAVLALSLRPRVLFPYRHVFDGVEDPEKHVDREPSSGAVAALYVDPRGSYRGLEGVDLWDEQRDARLYDGPHPVVAHPSCGRWCRLAHAVEGRYGYKVGDDGGIFAAALDSVRTHGGVLEHPAWTLAWERYKLRTPWKWGGWLPTRCGGFVASVEQLRYGHPAIKATWLYVHGVAPADLPQLRWGVTPRRDHGGPREGEPKPTAWVGHCTSTRGRPLNSSGMTRLSSKASSMTPRAFRDALLDIARSTRNDPTPRN